MSFAGYPPRCILSSVIARFSALTVFALFLVLPLQAEKIEERQAIALLTQRPEITLAEATKTSEHAMTRLHFWVGKDGGVEAVEQVCGERALFDEIVDAVLEWQFRPRDSAFVTDISFQRSGRRVPLFVEMPESERRRASDCLQ